MHSQESHNRQPKAEKKLFKQKQVWIFRVVTRSLVTQESVQEKNCMLADPILTYELFGEQKTNKQQCSEHLLIRSLAVRIRFCFQLS